MTALEMLDHSWVRGETARTGKIADSDKKLSMYKAYKSRLEQKVFESMIDWADDSSDGSDVSKRASLIERSFHMLDPGKFCCASTIQSYCLHIILCPSCAHHFHKTTEDTLQKIH
jgi:hypothetical protein